MNRVIGPAPAHPRNFPTSFARWLPAMFTEAVRRASGSIDPTTHAGVAACVSICSHRVTSSANPRRPRP